MGDEQQTLVNQWTAPTPSPLARPGEPTPRLEPFPPTLDELDRLRQEDRDRIKAAHATGELERAGDLDLPPRVLEVFGPPGCPEPPARAEARQKKLDAARSSAFVQLCKKRGERYIRRRFILEQIDRAPESERPTAESEREDLERRLMALEGADRAPGAWPTSRDWTVEREVWFKAQRERFDRNVVASPKGLLAAELARIYERIEPRAKAEGFAMPPLSEWNYSALLDKVPPHTVEPAGLDEGNFYRASLAFHWPTAWDSWRMENAPLLAARGALTASSEQLAKHSAAEGRLKQAIEEQRAKAYVVVRGPDGQAIPEELDGMYGLAARLAGFIERDLGEPEAAKQYRAEQRALLAQRPLFPPPGTLPWEAPEARGDFHPARMLWGNCLYLSKVLAAVLLPRVLEQLSAEQRAPIPALAQGTVRDLEAACWAPGRQLELLEDGNARLLDASGAELAAVPLIGTVTFEAVQHGAELLRSLTGQRVLFYLVREAHRQHGRPNAADVLIEGGLRGFAEAIGEHSKRAPDRIAEILKAGQSLRYTWPGGEIGGLWTYDFREKAAPGKPAILAVTPAAILRPYFAIKKLDADRRFSVPILPDPPFVGRERDWAAQSVFQFLLTAELLEHRVELARGAKLTADKLADLARRAGLPAKVLPAVLEQWTGPGGPFKRESDRYMLTDANPDKYGAAREWLLEAGRRTLGSRARRQRKRRPKAEA